MPGQRLIGIQPSQRHMVGRQQHKVRLLTHSQPSDGACTGLRATGDGLLQQRRGHGWM